MIHLSGFLEQDIDHPEGDVEIIFTGLRPGEKLYEELLIGDKVTDTEHTKIMRAEETVVPWRALNMLLSSLYKACEIDDIQKVRAILVDNVDGFKPQCEPQDLMQRDRKEFCKIKMI